MKKETQIVRHGEVLLKPVDSLPIEATLSKTTKRFVVAHSETGHHHVLQSVEDYEIHTWNGETYIKLGKLGKLLHKKTGKDVHKTHTINPGVYKIVIKKEFNYWEGIMKRVID